MGHKQIYSVFDLIVLTNSTSLSYIPNTASLSMSIELLRKVVLDFKKGPVGQENESPINIALKRREIGRGIKKLYNDTGEFMELINESLSTTSFEIKQPNFIEGSLPQAVINFFKTQYELMPEDITFSIKAERDTNNNHNVNLELKRRGHVVSEIGYCSYVRPGGVIDAHIRGLLDHKEMQPFHTVEAMKEIEKLKFTGNELVDDSNELIMSKAILEFAINEAQNYIQSKVRESTKPTNS